MLAMGVFFAARLWSAVTCHRFLRLAGPVPIPLPIIPQPKVFEFVAAGGARKSCLNRNPAKKYHRNDAQVHDCCEENPSQNPPEHLVVPWPASEET
jgi:hypothetical protein